MKFHESLLAGKEICVREFFDTLKELIRDLEDLIIALTCLILLAWTAYELIKKKIGF